MSRGDDDPRRHARVLVSADGPLAERIVSALEGAGDWQFEIDVVDPTALTLDGHHDLYLVEASVLAPQDATVHRLMCREGAPVAAGQDVLVLVTED